MKSCLALLALVLQSTAAQAVLVDKISAVVNNDVVLNSDLDRFERTISLRKELDPLFGFNEQLESGKGSRKESIEFLVQERLIGQQFKITDAEVEQEIQSVQRNNNLSREQLLEFLKSKGFNFNDYFELMRVGLQKRNLLDREIRSRVNISDDDIRNYYYNMAVKNSSIPLEYSVQLIVVNNSSYKTPAAAQQSAKDALRAIKQGESFAEVARRTSDDSSGPNGGDVGFIAAENMPEALRGVVSKLQIGAVSDVIKTQNGHMIVKLMDVRSTESQKFIEAKEQIREKLAKEEYKKQLYLWAERARNDAYVHLN